MLWFSSCYLLIIVFEIVFLFTLFSYHKMAYVIGLCFRILYSFTGFLLIGGSFHNGMWFLPIDIHILPFLCFYLILICYVKSNAQWHIKKKCYCYKIDFFLNDTVLCLKGYLDSGNLLTDKGMPIVFVEQKYESYFDLTNIHVVVIDTVVSRDEVICYPCVVALPGCRKKHIYVSFKVMELPEHCEVLLNMKLMKG